MDAIVKENSRWIDLHSYTQFMQQCKRARKGQNGREHAEGKVMKNQDLWSHAMRRVFTLNAVLVDLGSKETDMASSPGMQDSADRVPLFRPGQSVLQWWAGWFKNAVNPKGHYNKGERPTWFSGEIISPGVYVESMVYAGMQYKGFVYPVH